MADSLSLEHPDLPWALPAVLPSVADLRTAIEILETQSTTSRKHMAWCLSKLAMAFEPNSRMSDQDTKFRAEIWAEACGDLGEELWSKATLDAIQDLKWMPKPAEFRKFVDHKLAERTRRLQRCRQMLEAQGEQFGGGIRIDPRRPQPFVREPEDVRLRTLRDTLRKVGKEDRAAGYERQLAALEHREPEDWARTNRPAMPIDPLKPKATVGTFRSAAASAGAVVQAARPSPMGDRAAELAAAQREGRAPAPWDGAPIRVSALPPERSFDDIPEVEHGGVR